MSSFDKFYKQLSLFDRFVSGKVLSNKKIKLNEVKGVSVINDKGEEVPLRKLSSGEQNLIILYYKLAFSTDMHPKTHYTWHGSAKCLKTIRKWQKN